MLNENLSIGSYAYKISARSSNKVHILATVRDSCLLCHGSTKDLALVNHIQRGVVSYSSQSLQTRPESMYNCSSCAEIISNAEEIAEREQFRQ